MSNGLSFRLDVESKVMIEARTGLTMEEIIDSEVPEINVDDEDYGLVPVVDAMSDVYSLAKRFIF